MVRSTEQVRPRRRRSGGLFSVLAASVFLVSLATGVTAQQPTRPDTTRRPPQLQPPPSDTAPVRAPNMHPPQPDTTRIVPVPGPPVSADTPAVRRDTGRLAADTAKRDTIPPPQMPLLPNPVPASFATGVWVFGRTDIERLSGALTLADLLELIPGVARWRSGYLIQPEAVSAFSQTAGRIEVFLDGFELPAVSQGSPDLSRIELAEADSIRVERRLDVLHIEIRSLTPTTPQPYAYVQAGIGQPNARLFRGVFLAPHFLIGPVAFGVERLDTDGYKRAEPGNEFGAWGKWGKIWDKRGGIEAEFRTNTVHRDPNTTVPWVGIYGGAQWALRGRWQFVPGLVAEAFYGNTSVNDRRLAPSADASNLGMAVPFADTSGVPALPANADSAAQAQHQQAIAAALADTTFDQSDRQAGARLGFQRGPFWVNGSFRTHSAPNLPGNAGDATAGLLVPNVGDVSAGVHTESWTGRSTSETRLRGRLGPYRGLSAFAEVTSGERGVPLFQRDTATTDLFTKRSAWRAGADFESGWLSGGIARVSVTTDSIPGFGLPFDPITRFYPTGSMTGWESYARVRLFWKPLSAEYWYQAWTQFKLPPSSAADSIVQPAYTPDQLWRASLIYHQSPLKSGHLEFYARLDAHAHGIVYDGIAPTTPVQGVCKAWSDTAPASCASAALTSVDFFLQIRIMDLRLFVQERNILQGTSDLVTDFPSLYKRGVSSPRLMYGVRWQFFD